jgi:hypothetical protein
LAIAVNGWRAEWRKNEKIRKRLRCQNSFGIFIQNKKAAGSGVDMDDTFFCLVWLSA